MCDAEADSTPKFDAANDTWTNFISRVNKDAVRAAKKDGKDHEASLKAGRDAAARVRLHYGGEDVCEECGKLKAGRDDAARVRLHYGGEDVC